MSESGTDRRRRHRRSALAAALAMTLATALVVTAVADGHVERPSYWPDPAPDASVRPPAGGEVPKARSLVSALRPRTRGTTRVVCKGPRARRSLRLLRRSLRQARGTGYLLRPSQGRVRSTQREARRLRRINHLVREPVLRQPGRGRPARV